MVSLTASAFTNVAAFAARQQRPVRKSRGVQTCFAMADEKDDRKLNFDSNNRSALGFTESDSAGQTNIFAVEPKAYVAGTTADKTDDSSASTQSAAQIAGTVAIGAFVAGLLLVKDANTVDLGPTGDFQRLTEYSAMFAAEASAPAAAPALAD